MFNRRNFLSIGTSIFGYACLADILKANQQRSNPKSVVFLFFSGGMSHQESFIAKPDAIESQRPINGVISTKNPGIYLGSDWKKLSNVSDKIKLVHSFGHDNAGHAGGSHWVYTSWDNRNVDNGGLQDKPSLGSIISKYKGVNNPVNGIPLYVRANGHVGDGAAWLGKQYSPFDISGDSRGNIRLNATASALNDRRSLLRGLDTFNRESDRTGLVEAMDSFEQQAYSLITGNANEVFDINRESSQVRNQYGNSTIGGHLLLARRLVENGVNFVTINHGSWDFHEKISENTKRLVPEVDKAVAAFIDDVYQRGLENDVLLVMTGEFGRTSLNGTAGRDHSSTLSTLALGCGGINGGGIIGEANRQLNGPRSTRITPSDLAATIFNFMDIPQNLMYNDQSGRPQHMIYNGRPFSIN